MIVVGYGGPSVATIGGMVPPSFAALLDNVMEPRMLGGWDIWDV